MPSNSDAFRRWLSTCERKTVSVALKSLNAVRVCSYCHRHGMSSCDGAAERRCALTAHMPADDATFALAVAAWWQLRRSAYLLPHLRKGPTSIGIRSGAAVLAWVSSIVAVSTPLTGLPRPRAAGGRDDQQAVELLDTVPMATSPARRATWGATPTANRRAPIRPPEGST
jgi:hypothetical protein